MGKRVAFNRRGHWSFDSLIVQFLFAHWKTTGFVLALGLLVTAINLIYPIVIQYLIDEGFQSSAWNSTLGLTSILLGFLAFGFLMLFNEFLASRLTCSLNLYFANSVFEALIGSDYLQLLKKNWGEWMVSFQQIQEMKRLFSDFALRFVCEGALMVGFSIYLFIRDPTSGWFFLSLFIVVGVCVPLFSKVIGAKMESAHKNYAKADSFFLEVLRQPLIARVYSLQNWCRHRWHQPYHLAVEQFHQGMCWGGLFVVLFQLSSKAVPLGVLIWKLSQVQSGGISLGEAVSVAAVFAMSLEPMIGIGSIFTDSQSAVKGYEQIDRLVRSTLGNSKEARFGKRNHLDKNTRIEESFPLLRVQGVAFGYISQAPVLRSVSFDVDRGEVVGIAGENGAGKSTLLHLVCGLVSPWSGTVLINGKAPQCYDACAIRGWIGYIPQDLSLFSGTIAQNIGVGELTPNLKRVREVAHEVGAGKFIEELPEQFETQVSGASANFSWGQVQKIHLARVLYWNPKLLLFDEPTSALDKEAVASFWNFVDSQKGDRAILIVSHSSDLFQYCDRVIHIKQGESSCLAMEGHLFERRAAIESGGVCGISKL